MMKIFDLKPLFPEEAVSPDSRLSKSLESYGLIEPIVISERTIVDGNKRVFALINSGKTEVETRQVSGNPFVLHWQTNLKRTWDVPESALTFAKLPEENRREFCESMGISSSPQTSQILKIIAYNKLLWPPLIENPSLITILREIGNLKERVEYYISIMVYINGTIAEKRLISGLLRQCERREILPAKIDEKEASDLIKTLTELVQPRRDSVFKRIVNLFEKHPLPPATTATPDQNLEHPGLEIKTHIKRNELKKLDTIKNSLEKVFQQIEEL
ncbi:MAG: hypothetical protein HQM08_05435 [Candidatus Riflebacteria bacterium]|nr:hypothetical protein [Candidatus Riflebacteria bacterium]